MLIPEAVANLQQFKMIPVAEVIPEAPPVLLLQTKIITNAAGEIILKIPQTAPYGTTQLLAAIPEAPALLSITAAEVQIALTGMTIAVEVLLAVQADSQAATVVEAGVVALHLVVEVLHQEAQEVVIKEEVR